MLLLTVRGSEPRCSQSEPKAGMILPATRAALELSGQAARWSTEVPRSMCVSNHTRSPATPYAH